jgi:hypothetical protein
MAIRLTSLDQMPDDIKRSLRRFDSLFGKTEFIEKVLENPELYKIANDLDRLCMEEGVIGFHFTRAVVDEIQARGLEICSGDERRHQFLAKYGDHFSGAQRDRIRHAWSNFFDSAQNGSRDGRIWFNLTLDALDNGGADFLFTYFGGEAINMALTDDVEIAAVLRTLGQPLIVESALRTKELHTFSEIPWGKTWLSSHHVSINNEASRYDVDAYAIEPILTDHIVCIRVARQHSSPGRWRLY